MDSQQQHQLEGHHLQNFQTEMMDHNIHNLRNIEYETRTPVAQAGAATTAMDISTEQQQQQHYHSASHQRTAATEEVPPPEETVVVVWQPLESDILSGRGAKVNLNPGNARFRALCFKKQPDFINGSHAIKRRVATEIVLTVQRLYNSRFLKKTKDGRWVVMGLEASIAKASQVMRDYKRPDRAIRDASAGSKKRKQASTPLDSVPDFIEPVETNPFGIHDHDVLCGRGAYVNSHPGNLLLRQLAIARKHAFENSSFHEKTALASEIVFEIKNLDRPGRFLKKSETVKGKALRKGLSGEWDELSDEKAIHKVCQVLRDISRQDRQERDEKRRLNSKRHRHVIARNSDSSSAPAATATVADSTTEEIQRSAQRIAETTTDEVLQGTAVHQSSTYRQDLQNETAVATSLGTPGEAGAGNEEFTESYTPL